MISNQPMYPGAKDPTDKQPVAQPYRKNSAAVYNIVTNIPYNGTSASPLTTSPPHKPHREFNILTNKPASLNKIKKTAFETKMREVGENQQARDTDLQLNRFAHERHTESHAHGYDVLSNQSYAGRDAKLLVHPRTHSALTPWQAIESGLLVNNRVAPNSPSTSPGAKAPSTALAGHERILAWQSPTFS
ncbi:hypothetical protein GQ600_8300 [Phytophthora cactorum]|nr:hypothetical protein GQ600_8300 [Phytophthora cactorum]